MDNKTTETPQVEETPIQLETPPAEIQAGAEVEDDDAIDDEVIVSIGEPPAEQKVEVEEKDPKLVNKLRKLLREEQRRNREYEARLKTTQAPVENQPPTLGPKPKLEEHDYDAEKYETALSTWYERKRAADEHAAKLKESEEKQRKDWQSRLDAYGKAKASLRVRDYDEAEANVVQSLDVTQQGIIVKGSKDPAILTYAIGKDPAKLKELAAIKDPIEFAFAVAKLETQLRTMPKKPPAPEQPVKGAAPGYDHVSRTLDRLREGVANGSVPMSKLIEFKKQNNVRG